MISFVIQLILYPMKSEGRTNLSHLVDQLTGNISSSFKKQHIINEIKPCVETDTCKAVLKQVLGSLLDHAAGYSKGKNIRVSAKIFHDIVLLQLKYHDSRKKHDIEKNFEEIKHLLKHLGGCIYINDSKIDETTISITFLNHQVPKVA
jgi:hypothetical protein